MLSVLSLFMARVGVWHELPGGKRIPYSLANNYDPCFDPASQYDPKVCTFHVCSVVNDVILRVRIAFLIG